VKIAVMGAGAVGCYFGGMLARAGHAVMLVGRPQHVEAVRRNGLFIETKTFQAHVPMQASEDAGGVRGAQLVLCCVKSTDTEQAAADMAPHLASDTVILSLQNGVDNADRLQAALCREVAIMVAPKFAPRVAAAVVYVAAEMAGPGHVRHHGRGELVIGPSTASAELAALFGDAGLPVQISANVLGELWAKLILNCCFNPVSAITQMPYGRLFASAGVEDMMRDVVRECLAVAHGAGVIVPGDTWDGVQGIARTMPTQISSTAHDLARGKHTEIDHLNGYVLRKGEALGIATPANRVLHTLVKLLEARSVPTAADCTGPHQVSLDNCQ
jgi:2-dehydropantoate 2-reductase